MAIKENKMKKVFRPNLTDKEIKKFKADAKLISRHVSSEANLLTASKKLPVMFSQNQFAKAIGFSSFSELKLNKNSCNDAPGLYDLLDDVTEKEVYEAFKDKDITLQQAGDGLNSARKSLEDNSSSLMISISFGSLLPIINKSEFSAHEYKLDDSEPSEFKVSKTDEFFDKMKLEDQFILSMPNGKRFYYTVTDVKPYIYDKSILVYTITRGLWNSGFCAGAEVRGS